MTGVNPLLTSRGQVLAARLAGEARDVPLARRAAPAPATQLRQGRGGERVQQHRPHTVDLQVVDRQLAEGLRAAEGLAAGHGADGAATEVLHALVAAAADAVAQPARLAAVRGGLRAAGARGVPVRLLVPVHPLVEQPARRRHRGVEVGGGGGRGGPGVQRRLPPTHLGLLEELVRVEGVEGAQVVDDGEKLAEDGRVLGVLGYKDVLEHQLQAALHPAHQLGVPQPGPVWKKQQTINRLVHKRVN